LLAGGTLVAVLWGIDAWSLHQIGGILPWAKASLAALCVILPLAVLGWLSARFRSPAVTAILWLAAGVAFGWFTAQVAFRVFPWALVRWAPEAAPFVSYDFGIGPSTRGVLASMLCGLLFLLAGGLSSSLQEGATGGIYPAARALSILAWIGLFAITGAMVDSLVNAPLRAPANTVDELIAYRLSFPGDVNTPEGRRRHASVLNPAEDLLPRPHRIAVGGYDDTLELTRVLVDFEGSWVECTVLAHQPIFCETLD
jgi:hypothetical protein